MSSKLLTEFQRQGTQLTLELLAKLYDETVEKRNIIFSPFSIRNCMALAFAGACNVTAQEIANLMKYASHDRDEVARIFQAVHQSLAGAGLVKMANKVYVQNGYRFRKEYVKTLVDSYNAETESVNFAASQTAAQLINQWVKEKTQGKISELVSADCLDEFTRLVLLNAIHFKADWLKKFNEESTVTSDFWLNDNEKVSIPFMHQKSKFLYGYFEEFQCSALEMDYNYSNMSMLILLPTEISGLRTLLDRLKSNLDLKTLYSGMYPEDVNVKFPKFKVEFSLELSNIFKQVNYCSYLIFIQNVQKQTSFSCFR